MAGGIREPEVLIALLLRYELVGVEPETLAGNNLENLVAELTSRIPQFVKTVKSRAPKLESWCRQVSRNDLIRYLEKEKKSVRSQLFPRPQMRTIHKTRKKIKAIIYLSSVENKLKAREKNFYHRLEEIVGQFHDKQVLLGLLRNKKDDTTLSQRGMIRSGCMADRKEIYSLVRNYYRQL